MNKITFLAITLAALLLILSCEKEELNDLNTVVGLGEIVSKTLELDPFDHIEFVGVANFYVTLGEDQSVQLLAQQNIMDVLTWEVNFGTLIIGIKEDIYLRDHEEIRFDIAIPDLRGVLHDGVGNMILQGDRMETFTVDYRGVGHIDAYGLVIEYCNIMSSGVGDCKVQVEQVLEADISGIGNVLYRGNPRIRSADTGVGQLINDN